MFEPGQTVIRKADWRKGKKGPLGTVLSVHQPHQPLGRQTPKAWRGPKARVQWMWHHSGGVRLSSGQGNSSLCYCDTLQLVQVRVNEVQA